MSKTKKAKLHNTLYHLSMGRNLNCQVITSYQKEPWQQKKSKFYSSTWYTTSCVCMCVFVCICVCEISCSLV